MNRFRKTITALPVLLLCLSFTAGFCPAAFADDAVSEETVCAENIPIEKDQEFGHIYILLTNDEMNDLGFDFGDSITLTFSNGTVLEHIPYFSGYYVPAGELLLCGYPQYPHVLAARNYGNLWTELNPDEDTLVTITLDKKGEYLGTEELYNLVYEDVQREDETDEIFANFRAMKGGNLKPDWVYRSASPVDNTHNRAAVSNALAEKYGINAVLNLSDSKEELEEFRQEEGYASDYYDSLEQNGRVILLNLDANYASDKYTATLSKGLLELVRNDGPYLLHCQEGKDRTGFACALVMALAGGSRDEIVADYMETYQNYYGITKESQPDKYEAVTDKAQEFLDHLTSLVPEGSISDPDAAGAYAEAARAYLEKGGLTSEEIAKIEKALIISE